MSLWDKGLAQLPTYQNVCEDIRGGRTPVSVIGTAHIHKALFAAGLKNSLGRRIVLLASDEAEASRLTEDVRALGLRTLQLPARELSLRLVESASREYEQMRLGTFAAMAEGNYDCVVACVDAAIQYTIPPDTLLERTLELTAGARLPMDDLPRALAAAGYERCDQIEGAGQFAVRGGIVDVYPADSEAPIRMELWGDTVDTRVSMLCTDPWTFRF
jgi:transcription-repair coupling factor (superfamily II helicase)